MALPKYYAVKINRGHPRFTDFKNKFIEIHKEKWSFAQYRYYGYDGNPQYRGTDAHDYLEHFKNNPVELTIDEFFAAIESKPEITELPAHWYVKAARNDTRWNDFIKALNGIGHGSAMTGDMYRFYGIDSAGNPDCFDNKSLFEPEAAEITLDQFFACYNKPAPIEVAIDPEPPVEETATVETQAPEWTPKAGDPVEVRLNDSKDGKWHKRTFVGKIDKKIFCVHETHEDRALVWDQIRKPAERLDLSADLVREKFGIDKTVDLYIDGLLMSNQ